MIRRAAFTLVEMMVALAVTGLLTVMMLRMFSDSSTIWKTEDDRLDTFREARAALQLMSRDFTTALPLPNATSAAATDQYPALALRDRQTARSLKDVSGLAPEYFTAAYFLASAPNDGRGDLCALGYFLEWEPSIKTTSTTPTPSTPTATPPPRSAFILRRQMAQSDTTFARLRETLDKNKPLFGKAAFDLLYSISAPATPPGATAVPAPAPATETIASYIWDLQFAVGPTPATTPVPVPSTTPLPGKNGFYGTRLPGWVEIRFKALGSTAARKLAGNPLVTEKIWANPSDPAYIRLILPAEQQFVSRVKLAR